MKHVERAARWAGLTLAATQIDRMERYGRWLEEEAMPAGLLGPGEAGRIVTRHLTDALTFARAIPTAVRSIVDVGSGAGLPGIPLAIAFPQCTVTLLDRSRTRADLLSRVRSILALDRVEVVAADVAAWQGRVDTAVLRAVGPRLAVVRHSLARVRAGGRLVLGMAGADPAPAALTGRDDVCRFDIPSSILDGTHRLLMIRIRD